MQKTEVRTEVGVKTWTTTINYVVNAVIQIFLKYVDHRGLPTRRLNEINEVLARGFWTWLVSGDLETAYLEIWNPKTDRVVERLDLSFEIVEPEEAEVDYEELGKEQFKSYAKEINRIAEKLDALPTGCRYRVVVNLKPGYPEVDGWSPAQLRDISHLRKLHRGDAIDSGLINGKFLIWGEGGNDGRIPDRD